MESPLANLLGAEGRRLGGQSIIAGIGRKLDSSAKLQRLEKPPWSHPYHR